MSTESWICLCVCCAAAGALLAYMDLGRATRAMCRAKRTALPEWMV